MDFVHIPQVDLFSRILRILSKVNEPQKSPRHENKIYAKYLHFCHHGSFFPKMSKRNIKVNWIKTAEKLVIRENKSMLKKDTFSRSVMKYL